MKYLLILTCLLISSCSTGELKEYIDCAWDSNYEQYVDCLEQVEK